MLVLGLIVSVLFLGVCFFANSVDQNPKVMSSIIRGLRLPEEVNFLHSKPLLRGYSPDKNDQTDPELPNKEKDEKPNPPKPVVDDDGGV